MSKNILSYLSDLLTREGIENHDVIETIDELRRKVLLHRLPHLAVNPLSLLATDLLHLARSHWRRTWRRTGGFTGKEVLRAEIGREDDDRVGKVHHTSL